MIDESIKSFCNHLANYDLINQQMITKKVMRQMNNNLNRKNYGQFKLQSIQSNQ